MAKFNDKTMFKKKSFTNFRVFVLDLTLNFFFTAPEFPYIPNHLWVTNTSIHANKPLGDFLPQVANRSADSE